MHYRMAEAIASPHKATSYVISRVKEAFAWNAYYDAIREPKTEGRVIVGRPMIDKIVEDLKSQSISVSEIDVDVPDFRHYLDAADYPSHWPYYDGGRAPKFIEKALEHYLAARLLNLCPDDILIDVANDNSPAPEIYHTLYGCTSYRQDLTFRRGIKGARIGGDAQKMPVRDKFATKLSLHCSFEHFEGDSDMGFVREAARVLARGGRLCIVPLYLFERYAIQTNPALMPRGGIEFEPDAVVYCSRGWRNRHSRCYDVGHFFQRIVQNLGDLSLTIYVIRNEKEVDQSCYVKFTALFTKNDVSLR
jgi:hypothetical protein